MEMNNKNLTNFRKDFDIAMEALAKKYDVKIQLSGIRYNDDFFTAKVEGINSVKGVDTAHLTYVNNFKRQYPETHTEYMLSVSDLNKVFKLGRSSFKLIGSKRSGKNVICECQHTKTLKLIDRQEVLEALRK